MRRILLGLIVAMAACVTMLNVGVQPSQGAEGIVRAAFYYPWYPNAWSQSGIDPYTNYTPSSGYYASDDPGVIKEQIAAMQYAHLNAGIISWWGQGSQEDTVVADDLAAAGGTGFKWSLYYEPQGYSDPSVSQIQSDLSYIKARYASDPNYLTIDGKPVIFVYAGPSDGCATAQRWSEANASEGFYTVLKVFSGYTSCAGDASAWHQYAPSGTEDNQQGYSFSISPGFYQKGASAPELTRDLSRWSQNVKDMVTSNEPLQLVTTFNEWGEGTAIESATQWASPSGYGSYLDVMHDEIPVSSLSQGYSEVASDGGVFTFGGAQFFGSEGGQRIDVPMVGIASDLTTGGYWEVAADGGVFSFNALFVGSAGNIRLNRPIVGMAATPDGRGYWLVASDGGIFSFGDASFFGSAGNIRLNRPIVGMAATPDGRGYWLVASDGGIFSFGDASFFGSMGGERLNQPIVAVTADPATGGYWEVAADGGVFSFNAPFLGSTGGFPLNKPIVGMAFDAVTDGYWEVAADGGVFSFNAPFLGSTGDVHLNRPIVGVAPDQ